jgi:phosphoribosylformimino-5-aminoimidazole carboxamide ribonucleotide (ProFAR) isomerase
MNHKEPNRTVKQLLHERGIKQVQVALDLEIPYSRLNLVINGWQEPWPTERVKLTEYLDVEPEDLGW